MSWIDDLPKKRAFGELWAQMPSDPYRAAYQLFQTVNEALIASTQWIHDPTTLQARDAYYAAHGKPKPPVLSKEELLKKIQDLFEGVDIMTGRPLIDAENKLKAVRLYADIAGYIVKPDNTVNLNNNVSNRVMVMVDHGNDGDWQAKLQAQQRKLLADARN